MDNELLVYLEKKFDTVNDGMKTLHSRISGVEETEMIHHEEISQRLSTHKGELMRTISDEVTARVVLAGRLDTHIATPCPEVAKHEEDCIQNRNRQWTIFGIIIGLVFGLVELVRNFFHSR